VSQFLTTLDCRETDEFGGLWTLLAPLAYDSEIVGGIITVPAGFVTDFASVPRYLPIAYAAEAGKGNKAAVVHDWLYSTQSVDRATADKVLREALIASGYSKVTAALFYAAVRLGGASHWNTPNNPQPPLVQQIMEGGASLETPPLARQAGR
jgi:hypothetical protein